MIIEDLERVSRRCGLQHGASSITTAAHQPTPSPLIAIIIMPAAWEVTRDQKRAARDALIPAEFRLPRDHPIWERRKHTTSDIDVLENSGLLTEEDKRITSMSASALAAAIASKQMSSETVVKVRSMFSLYLGTKASTPFRST